MASSDTTFFVGRVEITDAAGQTKSATTFVLSHPAETGEVRNYLVTNAHVVVDAAALRLTGGMLRGQAIELDVALPVIGAPTIPDLHPDLALVDLEQVPELVDAFDGSDDIGLRLRSDQPLTKGSDVRSYGFPLASNGTYSFAVTAGQVSATELDDPAAAEVIIDLATAEGASGSPLTQDSIEGEFLVGVLTSDCEGRSGSETLVFAVTAEAIKSLIGADH